MRIPLVLLVLVVACGGASDEDTSAAASPTDAVLVHHDAEAFENAPRWRVSDTVEVTYDPGSRLEFDIPDASYAALFDSGHLVVLTVFDPVRLMLFGPDGRPDRLLARPGEGPGEVQRASGPFVSGDSILLVDRGLSRSSWYTIADGFIGSTRTGDGRCFSAVGLLANGRLLASDGCVAGLDSIPDPGMRKPTTLSVVSLDLRDPERLAVVPGVLIKPIETRYRGRSSRDLAIVRLGPRAIATAWGDGVAVATDVDGYAIDHYRLDGGVRRRIAVARTRRPVTATMREGVIADALAEVERMGTERMVDPDESRRLAREEPIADSLPHINWLREDQDGTLWVGDFQAPGDSTWQLTGFRPDGSIVARLSGSGTEEVRAIRRDRVLLRTVDDDGVVRFVVRRIVKPASP